ncbi:ganglioside GM2 activator [Galendromus occidentalis]|uniref:Ganglioside GM2 activator n=1 Tax=Galendromus occidentalis TaxID=34638 RepID=A0AAJ6QQF6_9ACAR|nr:ganglioside GM2 activator [Galendromus occidentalis]
MWWLCLYFLHSVVAAVSNNGTEIRPSRRGFARLDSTSCELSGSRRPLIDVRAMVINPNPIELPGRFKVQVEFKIRETVDDHLSLSLEMHKKFHILFGLYTWIKIPCLKASGIGSCTYDDLCKLEMFNGTQCHNMITGEDVECQCPYSKGHWRLPPTDFLIDEVPELPGFLLEGDFFIRANVKRADRHVACHSTTLKLNLHQNEL